MGGGITGVSIASELTEYGSVLLIDQESYLAYHTTGRSAAIAMEAYGNDIIRKLTTQSRNFFENHSFLNSEYPLIKKRGALIICNDENEKNLHNKFENARKNVANLSIVDQQQALDLCPYLSKSYICKGIYEPDAYDLDVHEIHSCYVKKIKAKGGTISLNTRITEGKKIGNSWKIKFSNNETISVNKIINAAGAWADDVAEACGLSKKGIQPLKRTVVLLGKMEAFNDTPYLGTVDEFLFIKPDAGKLMVSACDEELSPPCDSYPNELDIAIAMDRLSQVTNISVNSIDHKWSGLRNFISDRSPIIGKDESDEDFIWYAAVGGYGIQTVPALSQVCKNLTINNYQDISLTSNELERISCFRSFNNSTHEIKKVENLT